MTTGSDIAGPSTSGSVWKPQRQRLTTYRDSCHGRSNLFNPEPPPLFPSIRHRHHRHRRAANHSATNVLSALLSPFAIAVRESCRERAKKRSSTTGPPIIDAIAGVPLTQNKISARNVLCTPPSTPLRACLTLTRKLH
ncbi:hypothetical protein ALC57_06152 [Trachymyrmex cornetzi]|uniref:Uncharacterized protein n=1 Tax=Trachymyrmex cornetzi TaxID=471704 RepID=A0A195E8K9_9HYME|nr:hypothetical protein ALC57_06152 [Trachymyrmex cornetzi]